MKNKFQALTWPVVFASLLVIISFCLLLYIDIKSKKGGYDDLYFVFSNANNTSGVFAEKLEELNEDEFMLTYELKRKAVIEAVRSKIDVRIIATNSVYPFVMDNMIISGGFFTKNAMDQKSRVAVMDEDAAFEAFASIDIVGSEIKIDGEYYIVTGVIKDGNDEKDIYIPAVFSADLADAFLSVIKISDQYMKNEYKKAGITESDYTFVSLDTASGIIHEKLLFLSGLVLIIVMSFLLRKSVKKLLSLKRDIAEKLINLYMVQILKKEKKTVLNIVFFCVAAILETAVIFALVISLFCMTLKWKAYFGILNEVPSQSFEGKIDCLQTLIFWADVFFAGGIAFLAVLLISSCLALNKIK